MVKAFIAWLFSSLLDKLFKNRAERKRGAQEAASKALEDTNEKAVEARAREDRNAHLAADAVRRKLRKWIRR